MICKRCGNEMDGAKKHANDWDDIYDCMHCGAEYDDDVKSFRYEVAGYNIHVSAANNRTRIYMFVINGAGVIDNSINLKGLIYDLTEERIKKVMVLL